MKKLLSVLLALVLSASVVTSAFAWTPLFVDGFESGDFSAWNGGTLIGETGSASVTTTCRSEIKAGTYCANFSTGSGGDYASIVDLTPANEVRYHATFYANVSQESGTPYEHTMIFAGFNSATTPIFYITFLENNAGLQSQLWCWNGSSYVTTSLLPVPAGGSAEFSMGWVAGTKGRCTLTLFDLSNGTNVTNTVNLNNAGQTLDYIHLGIESGKKGDVQLDRFWSYN